MSRIFTLIIDDETFEEVKKELYNRGEFESLVINKMTDAQIIDCAIPFFVWVCEEKEDSQYETSCLLHCDSINTNHY